ncbi:TMV-MP30 binding protein 2C [Zea mays]|uniref:TMV-MP30 binding protein 2C n=1 Tax=Zea mays TaxID=4577 RepID=B6TCP7_MAIZE|nr:TMV-MP30 binding protein 2C [Zea mays]ACG34880.1 TMV-MP30 binding protein 2C [Zea mays]|eukprot:NP_001149293.1 TMV-MP30 binding protein 2C [Zea mays]
MAEKPAGPTPRTRIRGGLAASAPSSRRLSSVSFTAAPSKIKKVPDPPKAVRPSRATPAKKRPQVDQAQKRREEVAALQEQLNGLQSKLHEKDEALRSAENLIGRVTAANEAVDGLRSQLSEKELLIESTGSELHGAKIMLAEKQAALEKLEWEANVSSTKVEELQADVASMDTEVSALMKLFRKITESDRAPPPRDRNDDLSLECEPVHLDDTVDDIDLEKMEKEMSAYVSALSAAKENPTDEFMRAVADARLRLQAVVL